jgi:phage shock protein A
MMSISLAIELMLSALLVATLIYCVLLERRLSALRSGQDGLKDTIAELNTAIGNAGASMRALKASASSVSEQLETGISRGRSIADELSLLTSSGDRIASRIEQSAPKATAPLPSSLANRLNAMRPQFAANVR